MQLLEHATNKRVAVFDWSRNQRNSEGAVELVRERAVQKGVFGGRERDQYLAVQEKNYYVVLPDNFFFNVKRYE